MQFQLPFLFYDIVRPSLLLVFFLLLEIEDFVLKTVGTDAKLTLQGKSKRQEMMVGDSIWAEFSEEPLVASLSNLCLTRNKFSKCSYNKQK